MWSTSYTVFTGTYPEPDECIPPSPHPVCLEDPF